ncbi:unnamed protein product [Pelagomonas calceolata]|uniref:RING-type domain-containing protein n=3 Tax=Pelagomonas calceolata TaxID=35677 RepID=A0A8J2SMC6_9STRA|nr:unnamed protein product [Pelagomonas calceolata]
MKQFDKQFAARWVDNFSAAFGAEDWAATNKMLSDMSGWGQQIYADHINASEALDVIIIGLNRLNVAVPAGVKVARDAFTGIDWRVATIRQASVAPSLSRRTRLIIIGGAAVAVAAYVYHRRRRAAKRADLEAVKSLLAGGDSAVSLDDAAVTPQRRTPQSRPSAKERSKVMERNKKLQAQKRAAEQARDAATADAARARADNDRLRAENARLASNATAGDERDAARAESERLRTEVDRLGADIARLSENADQARVRMQRADEEAIADLRRENDALLAAKAELEKHSWDVAQIESERAENLAKVIARDVQIERLQADNASLVIEARTLAAERDLLHRENTSLLAERDALEESARLVPAPSAGDLAALSDEALAAFSAEAAALSHALVSEDARRAAIATTSTNECVVCHERPLEVAFGCGHFCACDACARGLSKCPICRAPVTERRRIYAS